MADEEFDESEEHGEPQLGPDGRYACGHTPEDHEALRGMVPVGEVNLTMTLPVTGYDPTNGRPILDMSPDVGYGLWVDVQVPGPHPLEVARNLLVNAIAKVDAGIARRDAANREGTPLTDDEINAVVADFDPDQAISRLLGGTHELPEGGDSDGGSAG